MKYLFYSTILLSALLYNKTYAQSSDSTWEQLFDGKTLKGWHTYGREAAGGAWKVEDGILHLDASEKENGHIKDGGDIVTDKEYTNFHLSLEWKISEGGNSGIMFYVNEDTSKYHYPWETGPEMQILDDKRHPDGKYEKHHAGDLYDLIAISPNTIKPVGEWNHIEIISDSGNITFNINKQKVLSTTMWDEQWNKLVSISKFGSMPGFGKYRKGKISLQDHGDEVWFRNIMIKEL